MNQLHRTLCFGLSMVVFSIMLPSGGFGRALAAGDRDTAHTLSTESRYRLEKTSSGGVLVYCDEQPIAEYVIDQGNKPFLWNIVGPSGQIMTRCFPMKKVTGESSDHVHQRGLSFGHQGVNGFDTWAEAASYGKSKQREKKLQTIGAIQHRKYVSVSGGPRAVIFSQNDFVDAQDTPLLSENRRITFSHTPTTRIIDVDTDLIAKYGAVELADMKDAGLYIRVPDSMTVDRKQGGTIINSEGHRDAEAWSKHAAWVDYNGPVEAQHVGIAMLNHPSSFRHPTAWHVRNYGLFCANPFGLQQMNPKSKSGKVSMKKGDRISLRHRFVFHDGDEQSGRIAEAFQEYSHMDPVALDVKD
ncbi:MAG: PmoA family protein [Pirellulales bacterium]